MLKIIRSRRIPALFTTMLSLPKLSVAHSMIRLADLKSVTLSKFATASPPAERISFTTSSAGERDCPVPSKCPPRSLTTTFAPCFAISSASSRPMPRPAPVTTATFPSSRAILLVPLRLVFPLGFILRNGLRHRRDASRRGGGFARSYYVEYLFLFKQRRVHVAGHFVDEVDGSRSFIVIGGIQHHASGASIFVKITRPGFADRHRQG